MYLTRELIRIEEFFNASPPLGEREKGEGESFEAGANVLFLGRVRESSREKRVLYLKYEAYEEMAERRLGELAASSLVKWPLEGIRILHRLGRVALGEIAVAIEVRSVHRDAAYRASRYLIEEIKHKVPIWKKEYFADGTSEWSGCPAVIAGIKVKNWC